LDDTPSSSFFSDLKVNEEEDACEKTKKLKAFCNGQKAKKLQVTGLIHNATN
jgi:hypothetical protein